MAGHDIIVVGASAGGVEAATQLVRRLPADLPAALFIVLHFPPLGVSLLPNILSRAGALPALHPSDGQAIQPGKIYIAPPNYHLLVKQGYVHLSRGAHENGHRPAVDPLFRTAARAYGPRVVGVILSGALDDGTSGLMVVKQRGGVAIVQDPDQALHPSMPQSAIRHVETDYVLPVEKIADTLIHLSHTPVVKPDVNGVTPELDEEIGMAELDWETVNSNGHAGTAAHLACPSCGGTLWEVSEGSFLRFRCRVGHAFSANSLLSEQSDALESALWTALRALEEKSALVERMARSARDRNHFLSASRFKTQIQEMERSAALIRQLLLNSKNETPIATELSSNLDLDLSPPSE